MAKLRKWGKPIPEDPPLYVFYCPGCKTLHQFDSRWRFDGDYEHPTFTPSLLMYGPAPDRGRCHLFLKQGMIQFLNDCQHELAGQTVPLPDLPEWAE